MRIGDVEIGQVPRIVVSLGANTQEVLGTIGETDLVEIRLDLLSSDNKIDLSPLLSEAKSRLQQPIIATSRHCSEGGSFHESEGLRLQQLWDSMEIVDAVDIEVGTEIRDSVMKAADRNNLPVILSYHNFHMTPSKETLLMIIDAMFEEGGDLAKIAVMPKTQRDVITVLEVLLEAKKPACAIAMGELGKHTRLIAPLYGSALTYAHAGKKTAPGQIHISYLKKALDMFLGES